MSKPFDPNDLPTQIPDIHPASKWPAPDAPAPDAIDLSDLSDLSDPDDDTTDGNTVVLDISVPDGVNVVFIVNGVKLL